MRDRSRDKSGPRLKRLELLVRHALNLEQRHALLGIITLPPHAVMHDEAPMIPPLSEKPSEVQRFLTLNYLNLRNFRVDHLGGTGRRGMREGFHSSNLSFACMGGGE